MPFLIIGGIIFIWGLAKAGDGGLMEIKNRLYDLPDIDPDLQGGNFKKDFDFVFEATADKWQVPFALLKAHAIKESSLNDKAFRDENPTKRKDRIGWVSRGLMQTLFWPGSTRFDKYGYTSEILSDGERLFNPTVNVDVAAQLIRENLKICRGNLRDAINMYNSGKKESVYKAPYNYVDDVIKNYEIIIKGSV